MALVVLSVVEQRLDAVRAVLAGESVVEVAVRYQVGRSTLHRWIGRYLEGSVAGLADRSHRPWSCPHQVQPVVEAAVAEIRRKHPRWGRNGSGSSCFASCHRPGPKASRRLRSGR
jgi:transposase